MNQPSSSLEVTCGRVGVGVLVGVGVAVGFGVGVFVGLGEGVGVSVGVGVIVGVGVGNRADCTAGVTLIAKKYIAGGTIAPPIAAPACLIRKFMSYSRTADGLLSVVGVGVRLGVGVADGVSVGEALGSGVVVTSLTAGTTISRMIT